MAIRNLFQGLGQRVGRGLTAVGGYDPMQQVSPEEAARRRQEGLAALQRSLGRSTAILSGDPRRVQFAEQQMQMAEQRKKQEERQKSLEALAQTNPELAKMYELFGERGLQQGYLRQQESLENEQARISQINSFINAGISYEDANLLAAGLSVEDIKSLRKEDTTAQNVIDTVNTEVEQIADETKYPDAYSNLDEAFGPQDAIQENLLNKPFRFLFGADPADETGAAIRSRNSLNLEIKAILAADYTGKPSNLLLQEIEKVLPTQTATSEKDAYEKYLNLLQRTRSRAKNLEQGIKSEITSNADKEKYREQLFKTRELEKKLDAAVESLKPRGKETLKADESFVSEGKYTSLYKNG